MADPLLQFIEANGGLLGYDPQMDGNELDNRDNDIEGTYIDVLATIALVPWAGKDPCCFVSSEENLPFTTLSDTRRSPFFPRANPHVRIGQ